MPLLFLLCAFVVAAAQKQVCPDGWLVFNTSCYFFSVEPASYTDALAECYAQDGSLFVPDSEYEWDMIRMFAPQATWSWIGLYQMSVSGKPGWLLNDGYRVDELTWRPTYHSAPYSPLNCAAYYASPLRPNEQHDYDYVSWQSCDLNRQFLCERNATASDVIMQLLEQKHNLDGTDTQTPAVSIRYRSHYG